jgi:predicted nucleic acid-binding protein
MIVVSNTTPINYLLLIGEIDVLPALYGRLLIPEAVERELGHPGAAGIVGDWIRRPPKWLDIASSGAFEVMPRLDLGESEAIALALERRADLILLDDLVARRAAQGSRLAHTGTLGILGTAAERGLLRLRPALERLQRTSFQASPALYRTILERASG